MKVVGSRTKFTLIKVNYYARMAEFSFTLPLVNEVRGLDQVHDTGRVGVGPKVDKECTKTIHSISLLTWVFYHCNVHSFNTFSPSMCHLC